MNSHFDQLMEEPRRVMVENNESRRLPKLPKDTCDFLKESRELTQKNNDLREERASLKFNSENLNIQYQQRLKGMFPRAAMDDTILMAPPSYQFLVPMPMPPGPIPMHQSMQPYPLGNQNPRKTFVQLLFHIQLRIPWSNNNSPSMYLQLLMYAINSPSWANKTPQTSHIGRSEILVDQKIMKKQF